MFRAVTRKTVEVADCLYAAGFFDGEGCIVIAKTQGKKRPGSPYYVPYVTVANTDRYVLDFLATYWNGSVVVRRRPNAFGKIGRPIWTWTIASRLAGNFLEDVSPFMRVKKRQAQLALEICYAKRFKVAKGVRVTEAQKVRWEEIRLTISRLNRFGTADVVSASTEISQASTISAGIS